MNDDAGAVVRRLESLIGRAGEELQRLREENAALAARVEELSAASQENEAGRAQRDELVQRLEALVEGFEEALDQASDS